MVALGEKLNPLPSVVIVGRPNVGKSTLFNAIIGQRRSIVGDEPGITRDRIYGEGVYGRKRFELIDTGGIIVDDNEMIPANILKQARVALEDAACIIFVVDGRTELTSADHDLAGMLRKMGKRVALAVNKSDSLKREAMAHEFHSLGFHDLFPIAAEHRIGFDDLLEFVTEGFPEEEEAAEPETRESEEQEDEAKPRPIKVAIIGRPNVGKSTLLNALAGEERSIVSPMAGTTRDAVDELLTIDGREYLFIDTAGIRRKGKTKLMAEKLSVVMARRHIRMANVVLLLVDATEGVVASDATIAGYAHEDGRCVVVVVNKWDAPPPPPDSPLQKLREAGKNKQKFTQLIRDEMKFLDYAPIVFVSAMTGEGVEKIVPLIKQCYETASRRIPTGELNRLTEGVKLDPNMKVFYMTQASVRPPTFVLFTDQAREIHFSTERFIVNQLRKQFGLNGTPIVLKVKRR